MLMVGETSSTTQHLTQEDNDYGEVPDGISAEDFEDPDAMPF